MSLEQKQQRKAERIAAKRKAKAKADKMAAKRAVNTPTPKSGTPWKTIVFTVAALGAFWYFML